MQGTEPDPQTAQAPQLHPKIVYPVDGTAMALDPDIPQDRQKIFFDAKPQNGHLQWMLNGKVIGAANKTLAWSAHAGSHYTSGKAGGLICEPLKAVWPATPASPSYSNIFS